MNKYIEVSRIVDKPFFHEITDKEWDAMEDSGKKWEEIMDKYLAPNWCEIADKAIAPGGCRGLMLRMVSCEDDCEGCNCKRS